MKENTCFLIKTGLIKYDKAHLLQKELLRKKTGGDDRDYLILSEHLPAITMGRGFKSGNLLAEEEKLKELGVSLHRVERGGDATYHGPGQAVAYPVIDLARRGRDLRLFIFSLEEVVIRTLEDFNIRAGRKNGSVGVWVSGRKIASVGVAVRKWISYHGFALNISTDLDNFSFINPCGLNYNVMTSVERELGESIPVESAENSIIRNFSGVFASRVIHYTGGETMDV